MGDVRRVQLVELALQLGKDLPLIIILGGLDLQIVLPVFAILTEAMALQQFDHLRQAVLQGLLWLFCFYFCHGALHPRPGARRGNQSIFT